MIRKMFVAAACAASLAAVVPAAAQDYPARPVAGPPKPFKVPASETYALANGMQVTLVPYGLTQTATVSLRIDAGNLNEGENVLLADLTGQMLKEGAGGRSAEQLATAAAGMGGDLGVGVGQHETSINLGVLSEHAGDAIRLVADVARRPDFPAGEIDRVKQNLGRQLAVALSQPQAIASAAFARAYYGPDHPYGRTFPSAEQIQGYGLDDVRGFYESNYGARRARLYVAGRYDTAAVKAAIDAAFSDWAAGPGKLSLPPQPKSGPQLILVDRPGAPQSTIRIGFPAPAAGSADDIEMRVMNSLLGGSFNSRITSNIRENKGYTYSPSSSIDHNLGEAGWLFQADVTTAVTGPALKEVFAEIRRMQTEAPADAEASGIRTYQAGLFILQNASAPAIIASLANRDFHGLPRDWLDKYVPSVLAVTPADMQTAASEYLPLDKATVVVVGDLSQVVPQLQVLPELKGVTPQRVTIP